MTRAINNLYWIESSPKQRLLSLIGLDRAQETLELEDNNSTLDEWRLEAHKLELQGKKEQADRIRDEILKQKTPDWEVLSGDALAALKQKAFEENNKKAKLALFEYALVYEDRNQINDLIKADFKPALNPEKGLKMLQQKHYSIYSFKKPDAAIKQVNQYGPDFRNVFNQTPLMVSAWTAHAEVIKALFEQGADAEKVDENGFTAFQIALSQADRDEKYAEKKLAAIYDYLEPTSMSIQVDGRLLKLDKRQMEFFMLNMMITMFYRRLPDKIIRSGGAFTTQDFINATEHMPDYILSERRKKRAYLSSILSKNEMDREDKHNRKLFFRIKHGSYLFNPNLSIKVEGEWVNIYDLLSLDKLAYQHQEKGEEENQWYYFDRNEYVERMLDRYRLRIKKQLREKKSV